jgi:hypothetical protein
MSFSLAIALIVTADIALIAGLAFVMSRASRLTPHASARGTGARAEIVAPAAGELHTLPSPAAVSAMRRREASAA